MAEMQRTLLVVDDEDKNLLIMESMLQPLGHRIVCISNATEALAFVENDPPDVILLDVMMPDLDGFTVCKHLKRNEKTRLIPIILVTALSETADKVRAFDSDADDFVSKPVNRLELRARVRSALRMKALNDQLEDSESVLYAFAKAVDAKDPYTIGHGERVAALSAHIAVAAELSREEVTDLRRGGLLHDIGKIGVPDVLLSKPGRLTEEEFEVIRSHTVIGYQICEPIRSFGGILSLIRSHHERLDGSGYPDGLRGDQIPVTVRILTIADVFDALTSGRVYREALPGERALAILQEEGAKGYLDTDLLERALPCLSGWAAGEPHCATAPVAVPAP